MFLKEFPEFRDGILAAMMFLLVYDVLNKSVFFLYGVCECAETIHPPVEIFEKALPPDVIGAGHFNVLDQRRYGYCRMYVRQDMYVVLDAVYPVRMAVLFIQNADYVVVQLIAAVFGQDGFPVFCSQNQLIKQLRVGSHDEAQLNILIRYYKL